MKNRVPKRFRGPRAMKQTYKEWWTERWGKFGYSPLYNVMGLDPSVPGGDKTVLFDRVKGMFR